MSKFMKYFLMEASDVIPYVMEKLSMFEDTQRLQCKEIGDGNLNYVFRVWDEEKGTSVIVKQEIRRVFRMSLSYLQIVFGLSQMCCS